MTRVNLYVGDVSKLAPALDAASFDAVLCDPPYGLSFMGRAWDHGVPSAEVWREILRVCKPGAPLVAFGGTRTYHRLAVAVEDAGFEIRDSLLCGAWTYGSGFPKSHDISKGIDGALGADREKVPAGDPVKRLIPGADQNKTGSWIKDSGRTYQPGVEIPATPEGAHWSGYGTALKPAWESIIGAAKPYSLAGECGILAQTIREAVCRLPSRAKDAELSSQSSRLVYGEAGSGSALWSAVEKCSTLGDLCGLTDTLRSESEIPTSLSIALSWLGTLAEICRLANTFTTETATSLTTDLKTLNSSQWKITPDTILAVATGRPGTASNASLAAATFSAARARLECIRARSAAENVTSSDGGEDSPPNWKPSWEPAVLAMAPLDGTFAANALKHGVAGLNIDGGRIAAGTENPAEARRAAARKSGNTPTHHGDPKVRRSMESEGRICSQISPERYMEKRPGEALGRWPSNLLLCHAPPQAWYSVKEDIGEETRDAIHAYYGIDEALPALRERHSGDAVGDQETQVLFPGVRWRQPPHGAEEEVGGDNLSALREELRGDSELGTQREAEVLLAGLSCEGGHSEGETRGASHEEEPPENERCGKEGRAVEGKQLPVEGREVPRQTGLRLRDDRSPSRADARDCGSDAEWKIRAGASGGEGGGYGEATKSQGASPPHQRHQGRQPAGESVGARQPKAQPEASGAGKGVQQGPQKDFRLRGGDGRVEVREDLIPSGWAKHFHLSSVDPGCREVGTRKVKTATNSGSVSKPGANAVYGDYAGDRAAYDYADADGTETVTAWDCAPECPVAGLDRQTGKSASASRVGARAGKAAGRLGEFKGEENVNMGHDDTGGASRFYFQAAFENADFLAYHSKASRAEREIGMPPGELCRHPTLKPIALMAYLAKLLLPPPREDGQPRRLLVPFAGAGSEIVGACRAGWEEVVGMELELEHVEWARLRVEGDAPLFNTVNVTERISQ